MIHLVADIALQLERSDIFVLNALLDLLKVPDSLNVVLSSSIEVVLLDDIQLSKVSALGRETSSLARDETILSKVALYLKVDDESRRLLMDHCNLSLDDVVHALSFVIFHKNEVVRDV